MILTCPNCGTQYVVKDGAIPPEGRQVRCAACKHSWHQDPEQTDELRTEPQAEAAPALPPESMSGTHHDASDRVADDESVAEATLIEPRSGPDAEERAYEEAVIDGEAEPSIPQSGALETVGDESAASGTGGDREDPDGAGAAEPPGDWNEPPTAEANRDVFSPFAEDEEVEPRRRNPLATIVILMVVLIAAAALFWFFAPNALKAKLGIAQPGATPLQLVTTHMNRTPLESGNELLTVTGRVINPSAKEQDVPPMQAQLKNKSGKVVYSWTIQPPAHTLAAGASASFNSAEVNIPPGGDELTITLGQPRA